MKEIFIRKKIFYLFILLFLTGCKNKEYEIIEEPEKTEYILDDIIIDIWKDHDLITGDNLNILDDTDYINPYYKIYDSFLINDRKTMNEIIGVILDYDTSSWNRNKITMYYEWLLHNYLYKKGIEIERTKDVDFNLHEFQKKLN